MQTQTYLLNHLQLGKINYYQYDNSKLGYLRYRITLNFRIWMIW